MTFRLRIYRSCFTVTLFLHRAVLSVKEILISYYIIQPSSTQCRVHKRVKPNAHIPHFPFYVKDMRYEGRDMRAGVASRRFFLYTGKSGEARSAEYNILCA